MKNLNQKKQADYGSSSFANSEDFFYTANSDRQLPHITGLKKDIKKTPAYWLVLWLLVLLLIAGLAYGSFFAYKIYSVGKKVNIENNTDLSFVETVKSFAGHAPLGLNGEDKNRINILLLGIAGKGKPGQFLTDTIMVASLDTKTNRVALLSLPRDLFVSVPNTTLPAGQAGIQTKINSVYQYSLNNFENDDDATEIIKKTITNITGLDINYFVVMNFDGFQKAIDDIDGINIVSERNIYDARYPGPNYSYETFELSKGFHHLDGATALKYARERHNDPEGDFGRAKRQQQIMQATKNKIFSAGTMLDVFALNNLFDTLGDNIKTDIRPEDFASFFELMKKIDTNNINNVVVDAWNKDSLLKVAHIQIGDVRAFALVPRIGNYSEIQDLAGNIFDLNKIKRRRDEIAQENATIAIINKSGDAQIIQKIKKVLQENLNYRNVIILADSNKDFVGTTTAYDLTNGQKPFTLDELATRLPATVSYDIPADLAQILRNKTVDMAVVVGKDLTSKYNIEEGTIEDLNKARDDQESQSLLKN